MNRPVHMAKSTLRQLSLCGWPTHGWEDRRMTDDPSRVGCKTCQASLNRMARQAECVERQEQRRLRREEQRLEAIAKAEAAREARTEAGRLQMKKSPFWDWADKNARRRRA